MHGRQRVFFRASHNLSTPSGLVPGGDEVGLNLKIHFLLELAKCPRVAANLKILDYIYISLPINKCLYF
jgi:hypothetical protein